LDFCLVYSFGRGGHLLAHRCADSVRGRLSQVLRTSQLSEHARRADHLISHTATTQSTCGARYTGCSRSPASLFTGAGTYSETSSAAQTSNAPTACQYNFSELRTFRHYDVSPLSWTFRPQDVSYSRRFAPRTFRHLDTSPPARLAFGRFAPCLDVRSFAGRFAPTKIADVSPTARVFCPFLASPGHNHINKKLDLC